MEEDETDFIELPGDRYQQQPAVLENNADQAEPEADTWGLEYLFASLEDNADQAEPEADTWGLVSLFANLERLLHPEAEPRPRSESRTSGSNSNSTESDSGDSGSFASVFSQASEGETPGSGADNVNDLTWDDFEEAGTPVNDQGGVLDRYVGPGIHDWVPGRLSSEYTNQIEVSLLPRSTATDDRYFDDDSVFSSSPTQGPATGPQGGASSSASRHNSQPYLGAAAASTPSVNDQSAASSVTSSAANRATPSRIPVRVTPDSRHRHSNRLQSKTPVDYRSLHRRGRGGPQ